MKKLIVALAAAGLIAGSAAAIAAEGDFEKADANGDGKVTLEEGMAVHTDWTADAFAELDTDGDGALSKEEYDAAMMKQE